MSRSHRGPSESQANAEALRWRDAPFSAASEASFAVKWDWHRREPADLREAVFMVRRAYSDEVPQKMHDGPNAIGDDGTPRMAAKAVGYIFGPEDRNDAGRNVETGQRDLIGWYYAPFRALLRKWSGGNDAARKRAAIVRHVAIGSQEGVSAAITEGVPSWCAYLVAEHTLREFCRNLTDFNLHPPKEQNTVV